MSWHNSLSVGVDHIDKQHQYFINLINRIHGAIENSYTAKIVEALLDMKAYTEVHFTDEENFMARKGYPRLDEHIALHRGFIRKAESFLDDLEQHPLAISSEVSNYLVTWAVEHIQKVDAKYGDFLREGVTAQCSRKGDPQCTTIKV